MTEAAAASLHMRVIDTGAGLCTVTRLPGGGYFIYDAGLRSAKTADAMLAQAPAGSVVEFLVISHTDADHLGNVPSICEHYSVRKILYSEVDRDTAKYAEFLEAIQSEAESEGAELISLASAPPTPGTQFALGGANLTYVFGANTPPDEWGLTVGSPEWNNAGSIVMRLECHGRSILLTGDTVGREVDEPDEDCRAAELVMVAQANAVRLDSDVIIAPHHGADNASSAAFIQAVSPDFVVFSAGSVHSHPRRATAERYIAAGVLPENMLRTDIGDDEGDKEWDFGRVDGNNDPSGDDHVDIEIMPDGEIWIDYVPN